MLTQFKGLILSETKWGENDKILTVLTAEAGKIAVILKGGSSLKNKAAGACIPMTYTEFVTADRGGRPWVREADTIESFSEMRDSLEDTALAIYMCDVANEVCVENLEQAEMLQLMLNTLYALNKKMKPRKILKAAFEMRVAAVSGFSPDLTSCVECGCENSEIMYLDVMDGVVECDKCRQKHNVFEAREGHTSLIIPLERELIDILRYVCYSNAKKYLNFDISDLQAENFAVCAEKYLLNQLERGFMSLDFYKSVENTGI